MHMVNMCVFVHIVYVCTLCMCVCVLYLGRRVSACTGSRWRKSCFPGVGKRRECVLHECTSEKFVYEGRGLSVRAYVCVRACVCVAYA